jgi:rhodanese-related sulfurtransferase
MFRIKRLMLTIFLFIGAIFMSCKGQGSKYISVQPEEFKNKLDKEPGAQLVDVRTPEEYSSQHIGNAVNLNISTDQFKNGIVALDKSKPVYVYCLSGGRSKRAAQQLANLGFSEVIELDGGIMKWNAAGLADEHASSGGMSVTEYESLLKADTPVLVNFYADWCAPCKKMSPYILRMQKEKTGKLKIVRLNADEHKSLLKSLGISELPGLLLYRDGKLQWNHFGYLSETDLMAKL